MLCAMTVAHYAPLRTAPFVYEDTHALRAMDADESWIIPSRVLTHATYRWSAGSPIDPGVFHLGNVAIHVVNGLLVYAVGVMVIGAWPATFAAGLFLWHPLNSEAVSYVSGRSDLLLTLCLLLAVWIALLRGAAWWRGSLVALALVGAATSKEIGLIGVPLVVLALWIWRRESLTASAAPLWLGLGLVSGTMLGSIQNWMTLSASAGGATLAWSEMFVRQIAAVTRLLALVVWPVGFSVDHDMLALGEEWRVGGVWLLTAGAIGLFLAWHRSPGAAFSLGWMALAIGPRLVFHTTEWINEHQMYLAMAGVSWLGGLALQAFWHRKSLTWLHSDHTSTNPILLSAIGKTAHT